MIQNCERCSVFPQYGRCWLSENKNDLLFFSFPKAYHNFLLICNCTEMNKDKNNTAVARNSLSALSKQTELCLVRDCHLYFNNSSEVLKAKWILSLHIRVCAFLLSAPLSWKDVRTYIFNIFCYLKKCLTKMQVTVWHFRRPSFNSFLPWCKHTCALWLLFPEGILGWSTWKCGSLQCCWSRAVVCTANP